MSDTKQPPQKEEDIRQTMKELDACKTIQEALLSIPKNRRQSILKATCILLDIYWPSDD